MVHNLEMFFVEPITIRLRIRLTEQTFVWSVCRNANKFLLESPCDS